MRSRALDVIKTGSCPYVQSESAAHELCSSVGESTISKSLSGEDLSTRKERVLEWLHATGPVAPQRRFQDISTAEQDGKMPKYVPAGGPTHTTDKCGRGTVHKRSGSVVATSHGHRLGVRDGTPDPAEQERARQAICDGAGEEDGEGEWERADPREIFLERLEVQVRSLEQELAAERDKNMRMQQSYASIQAALIHILHNDPAAAARWIGSRCSCGAPDSDSSKDHFVPAILDVDGDCWPRTSCDIAGQQPRRRILRGLYVPVAKHNSAHSVCGSCCLLRGLHAPGAKYNSTHSVHSVGGSFDVCEN